MYRIDSEEKEEDIIITTNSESIRNGMKSSTEKFKTYNGFYFWEVVAMNKLGYNPKDYKIKSIIPGLSDRSEESLEKVSTYIIKAFDAYSISIVKIK